MARKRRVGEVTCRCFAYRFPHRMMGGRCDGGAMVGETFEAQMFGACLGCMSREYVEEEGRIVCQVVQGVEPSIRCPELQEVVRFNEIRLYGVNACPEIENPRRRKCKRPRRKNSR